MTGKQTGLRRRNVRLAVLLGFLAVAVYVTFVALKITAG